MFSTIDWAVVGLYIALTTWIGHRQKGRQQTTHDFFLGGRNIPWYAVSASIIATTISAVTFIGVPAITYAAGGNFTYLQLALGGILARLLIAHFLLPRYFEGNYYSPYDFMSDRFGAVTGRITAGLFMIGGVLGQSVRVYATALVIELLTGWSMGHSILVIAAFAILWTWMGGVAAVIWTDVVQFFVLVIGALAALFLITIALPDGWSSLVKFWSNRREIPAARLHNGPSGGLHLLGCAACLTFSGRCRLWYRPFIHSTSYVLPKCPRSQKGTALEHIG